MLKEKDAVSLWYILKIESLLCEQYDPIQYELWEKLPAINYDKYATGFSWIDTKTKLFDWIGDKQTVTSIDIQQNIQLSKIIHFNLSQQ